MVLDKNILKEKQQKKRNVWKVFYVNLFAIIAICVLGTIIYSNTFSSTFHFDDQVYITDNSAIRNIGNLNDIWHFYPTRFITFLSFALNYHFFQLNVFFYHFVNLIIHLGSAILVWWFVILIFSTPVMRTSEISKYSSWLALFIALIFVSHPIQTESVTYIWQRTTSLAAFFYLFSLCLYIKTRLLQIDNNSFSRWGFFYIFSLVFAIVSMFTKENAVTLCLIIILCEFCFFRVNKSTTWKYALSFLITLPIVPLTLFFAKPETLGFMERLINKPIQQGGSYFLTQLRVMLTYIRLLFIPLDQNLYYDYPLTKSLMDMRVLGSLFILVLIIISAIRIFPKYKLVSFGIFWFFLTLLPESSIVPIDDVIFEHRLYLPMVGFVIFLVSGLCYLFQPKRFKLMVATLSVIVITYSIMAYERNKVWIDDFTLWTDTIKKSPNKAKPYNNQGLAYYNRGELDKALSDYNKAIEIDPKFAEAYSNIGLVYRTKNEFDQAIYYFSKAIEIDPYFARAYNNRGVAYHNRNEFEQALSDYNKAIEIDPRLAEAYNNIGLVYRTKNEFDQAIFYFSKAIEINLYYAKAYNNRGVVYHSKGKFDQALSDYNKAIEIDPITVGVYSNRELLYQAIYNKQ